MNNFIMGMTKIPKKLILIGGLAGMKYSTTTIFDKNN